MFKKGFVFPSLQYAGYDSGFSVPITAGMRNCPDLHFELIRFSKGKRSEVVHLPIPKQPAKYCRFWVSELVTRNNNDDRSDLYCVRFVSPSNHDLIFPETDAEGQMMFRHQNGWISSVLTGIIPLRAAGHRYAPIIHTSHCMADSQYTETTNLFMNVKNIDSTSEENGGMLVAEVSSRDGNFLGKARYNVLANSTTAISHDTIAKDCGISEESLKKGINIKFYGGESQFSILTMFRHRGNGSITMEHSLAPLYYIPALKTPDVRAIVYGELEAI